MRVRVPPPAPFFWLERLTRAMWANQSAASSQIRCQRAGDGPFRGQKIVSMRYNNPEYAGASEASSTKCMARPDHRTTTSLR